MSSLFLSSSSSSRKQARCSSELMTIFFPRGPHSLTKIRPSYVQLLSILSWRVFPYSSEPLEVKDGTRLFGGVSVVWFQGFFCVNAGPIPVGNEFNNNVSCLAATKVKLANSAVWSWNVFSGDFVVIFVENKVVNYIVLYISIHVQFPGTFFFILLIGFWFYIITVYHSLYLHLFVIISRFINEWEKCICLLLNAIYLPEL